MKRLEDKPQQTKALCEQQQRDLQGQVQPYLDRDDPEGLAQIPSLADSAARSAESTWSTLTSDHTLFDAGRNDTTYLSASEGRWNDVRNSLVARAAALTASWAAKFEGADKACRDLRAGVKSPIIEKALTQLASKAATRDRKSVV